MACRAWTLIVAFGEPVAGDAVSDPYTGYVTFNTAATMTPATPLPDDPGYSVAVGMPQTIPVTIKNTSNAPQDYFLDPRLNASTAVTLAPLTSGTSAPFAQGSNDTTLPVQQGAATPLYFVPALTSSLTLQQVSSVAAMTDLSTAVGGDPDVGIAGLAKGSCARSRCRSPTRRPAPRSPRGSGNPRRPSAGRARRRAPTAARPLTRCERR
jgi:hypothetical protein